MPTSENATEFIPFSSEGPWKAYVVNAQTEADRGDPPYTDPNRGFISLSVSDTENTSQDEKGVIHGVTGSDIKFDINFNGTIAADAPNRNAIVRVEYHNYTCEHLIFVHQGNRPQKLLSDKPAWHVSNLVSKNREASNPLDEGSLFKYKNLDQPIAAKNQYSSKIPMIDVTSKDFPDPVSNQNRYELVGGEIKKWMEITNQPANNKEASWGLDLTSTRIAQIEDYEALFENEMIAQGYGVLYGDESTEPKTNIVDAYGYQEDQAYYFGGSAIKDRGIRGCFVYNRNTGNHIFLPVGASGYGHRKAKEGNGVLRYSCGQTQIFPTNPNGFYTDASTAPLFYDLYMRPGAIYWTEDVTGTGTWGTTVGWDINYFTFDFNRIYEANVFNGNNSDACFIRCVEDPN